MYICRSASIINVAALNSVTSLTVNPIKDILLQVLQNFQHIAVVKIIE